MSYNCKEVTRNRPCPICGKPDYCSFWTPADYELVICKRATAPSDTTGVDGKLYKYVATSKSENFVFQEMAAYEDRRAREKDVWMREHQVGPYNPHKKGEWHERPSNAHSQVPIQAVKPVEWTEPDKVESLPNAVLDRINRAILRNLVLDPIHQEYLLNEGWTEEMIEQHQIRSFPVRDIIRFKYKNFKSNNPYRKKLAQLVMEELHLDNLIGVPGAFIDNAGNWTFAGPSGILFPIYDADGYLYGFRIRMDFMDIELSLVPVNGGMGYYHGTEEWIFQPLKGFYRLVNGKKVFPDKGGYYTLDNGTERYHEFRGKYRPFSSFHQKDDAELNAKHIIVNSYNKGCRQKSGMSLYFKPGEDNAYVCYLTEGEKKGIFANEYMGAPFVTFPGVDSWAGLFEGDKGKRPVDILKKAGVQLFVVMYDADKETNANVLRAQGNVVKALQAEGFDVGLGNWDQRYGKGLDDILANGYLPSYCLL